MRTNKENQKKAFIKNIVNSAVHFGLDSIQCQVAMSVPQRTYRFNELNRFIGEMTIALRNEELSYLVIISKLTEQW